MVSIQDFQTRTVNLPILGTISLAGLIVAGGIIFFLLRRKKQVTLRL